MICSHLSLVYITSLKMALNDSRACGKLPGLGKPNPKPSGMRSSRRASRWWCTSTRNLPLRPFVSRGVGKSCGVDRCLSRLPWPPTEFEHSGSAYFKVGLGPKVMILLPLLLRGLPKEQDWGGLRIHFTFYQRFKVK